MDGREYAHKNVQKTSEQMKCISDKRQWSLRMMFYTKPPPAYWEKNGCRYLVGCKML